MLEWRELINDKRITFAAMTLVVVLILHSLGRTIVGVIPPKQTTYQPVTALKNKPIAIPNIAMLHLFGFHQDQFLPTTRLDVALAGIFFARDHTKSQVLIGQPGAMPDVYREGQELPGGVRIYRILPNRVILQHDNKLETLPLEQQSVQLDQEITNENL